MKISDALISELNDSISKLEAIAMERDEDRAEIFDAADDHAYENAAQLLREQETYDALEACVEAGVDKKHLRVLARETGMCTWAMKQSLKG